MKWEDLTSPDFAKAVRETGVCILPMGVLEKHGEHLPLGTDVFSAHRVATLAAEIEPAVVFPGYYFGQIFEASCFPGTFTLPPELLVRMLITVLDEIGRNGFGKIIIYNWHGSNLNLVGLAMESQLWKEKPYVVYVVQKMNTPERHQAEVELLDTRTHSHAGEYETSCVLAIRPHAVKMDAVPDEPALPLKTLYHLDGLKTAVSWRSKYPEHYSHDARPATPEKGKVFLDNLACTLAEYISVVKADTAARAEQESFFKRKHDVGT